MASDPKKDGGECSVALTLAELSDLAISVWRIKRRAERFVETPQPVNLAIQGALERFEALGVTVTDMTGLPYDDNMRVRVVDIVDGGGEQVISECVTPAVYCRGTLARPADVVVTGTTEGDRDGERNG